MRLKIESMHIVVMYHPAMCKIQLKPVR